MSIASIKTSVSDILGRRDVDACTDAVGTYGTSSEWHRNAIASSTQPVVAILLCTHHGGRFLSKQLDSISTQKHHNLFVWASDDGSGDDTHYILKQYQSHWEPHRFSIHSGPQEGFVANFLSLTCYSDIEADYFAYADQDDIWEPDKLSRAIERLNSIPADVPALYCSRTRLIDERGQDIGLSPLFDKPPTFANALIQNIAGGNTMVMNKAARKILCEAGERNVVSHDWWTYILIAGVGGTIIYDPYPSVRYRQHDRNLVGSNIGWYPRLLRTRLLLKNRFKDWNTINIRALQQVRHLLTPANQDILDEFSMMRDRWLFPRILGIWKSGVYRQTVMGNLGLIAAIVLKKL